MSDKFTDIQLAAIARSQGCVTDDLKRRWIVQYGKSFYIMGTEGEYLKPITKGELANSLRRDLLYVPGVDRPCGIDWYKRKDDVLASKSVDEILFDHCTVARDVIADMSLSRSYYDAKDQVMYEAVCPLAKVAVVYHEQIAEWLRLLGGTQHDKLLDWIATMHQVNLPTCALLFTGKSGAGKELLAQGLARRWRRVKAPTELARIMEGFNEDLARCPLVFCDENMPTMRSGKRGVLADLRNMIMSSSRTLSRKFLSNASLIGAIRLILAANNPNMLSCQEDMTSDDQEATSLRFMHIRVSPEPVAYLASIGGRAATEGWVRDGLIAEHVAWLEQNRQVQPGDRSIVRGDASDLQRQLLVSNRHTSLVLEWVVRHLANGAQSNSQILIGNGSVLVNTAVIAASWGQYIKSDFVPSTTRIGTALRNLAMEGEVRLDWPAGTKVTEVRYKRLKPEYLYEWSLQNQIGSPDLIKSRIDAALDVEDLKKSGGAPLGGFGGGYGSNGSGSNSGVRYASASADVSSSATTGTSFFDDLDR
jgi:hypothetical protein